METIADFEIQYSQFLDPEGNASPDIPELARNTDELVNMYRHMTETRVFDTKAVNLQRTGKLGTYASCLGHEATHVGLAAAMHEDDVLAPSYREYGAMFYRGVRMSEVLLYWGGDERGSDFQGPKNDFPFCVPIATQTLHAAGAAMAFQLRGESRCAVSVNGDGGTSEGAFYEAMNIAGARKLPVVFIVVNNKWAISVPIELQTASKTLAQKAVAAGIPGIQVDGNDVIAGDGRSIETEVVGFSGDRLVLTKPLGTGVVTTALKNDATDAPTIAATVRSMTTLNAPACEAMKLSKRLSCRTSANCSSGS